MDYQEPPAMVQPAGDAGKSDGAVEKKGMKPDTEAMKKVDATLIWEFDQTPNQDYGVIVWFTKLPDDKTLETMKLRPVPPDKATGNISRARIEELAKRVDVRQIRSRPKPSAF